MESLVDDAKAFYKGVQSQATQIVSLKGAFDSMFVEERMLIHINSLTYTRDCLTAQVEEL